MIFKKILFFVETMLSLLVLTSCVFFQPNPAINQQVTILSPNKNISKSASPLSPNYFSQFSAYGFFSEKEILGVQKRPNKEDPFSPIQHMGLLDIETKVFSELIPNEDPEGDLSILSLSPDKNFLIYKETSFEKGTKLFLFDLQLHLKKELPFTIESGPIWLDPLEFVFMGSVESNNASLENNIQFMKYQVPHNLTNPISLYKEVATQYTLKGKLRQTLFFDSFPDDFYTYNLETKAGSYFYDEGQIIDIDPLYPHIFIEKPIEDSLLSALLTLNESLEKTLISNHIKGYVTDARTINKNTFLFTDVSNHDDSQIVMTQLDSGTTKQLLTTDFYVKKLELHPTQKKVLVIGEKESILIEY
jgi:hypothetical protein